MIVRLSRSAKSDLQSIAEHIAVDAPQRALTFFRELREACRDLGQLPERFPYFDVGRRIRRRPYGAYLIFYVVQDGQVEVLHILHGARDYDNLL